MKFLWISILVLLLLLNCSEDVDVKTAEIQQSSYPETIYNSHDFISSDYIFENESLNRPISISTNPITNEVIVLDDGNRCLYVFSDKGEFIRKIGEQKGQGPGDMLWPMCLTVDYQGKIYVGDMINNRISIFSPEGKFIKFIRVNINEWSSFSVTKNNEIVVNQPSRGYYLTVFSEDGELLKEVGKIPKINDKLEKVNIVYAESYVFIDNNGTHYVFLRHLPLVKIYNEEGILIKEKWFKLTAFLKLLGLKNYVPPEKQIKAIYRTEFFRKIEYKNNQFYALVVDHLVSKKGGIKNPQDIYLYVIDKNLNITKVFPLLWRPIDYEQSLNKNIDLRRMWWSIRCTITLDENYIYIPHFCKSEILRFSHPISVRRSPR